MGTGARADAFERLVRDRSSAMKRTAYLLTGDHYLAEDLLQAALTKTYLRWGTLRDQGAAEAYVRRVMASISTRWWQRRWHGERPTEVLPDRVADTDEYAHADERSVTRALLEGLASPAASGRSAAVLRGFSGAGGGGPARHLGRHGRAPPPRPWSGCGPWRRAPAARRRAHERRP